MYLPPIPLKAIDLLTSHGYKAYAVGGCVRDSLRGVEPSDYDIATSAFPNEVKAVFSKNTTIDTGIAHGTVTVLMDGEPLEITTFRIDGEYEDHRHPSGVSFTRDIKNDLARRDLTINAMAYSPTEGLIDLFGGREDLENGIIRAVGDPEKRFQEDALRILRALRFASILNFRIEDETKKAMLSCRSLLKSIAAERICSELSKLLLGDSCERILTENAAILTEIIPELAPCVGFDQKNPHHIYDVYLHTVHTVASCPKDKNLRFAALLHDCGKPDTFSIGSDGIGHFYGHSERSLELAKIVLERLKFDNDSKNEILTLIKYHDPVIAENQTSVGRIARKIGIPKLKKLLDLKSADNLAQAPSCHARLEGYEHIRKIIDEMLEKESCFSLKKLAINGDDLIKTAGFTTGKALGAALSALLDEVIDGSLPNEREALIARAIQLKSDHKL